MFSFIPLVIIMFRKQDSGIRGCSRKKVLNRNVFLTTSIGSILEMACQWLIVPVDAILNLNRNSERI